MTRDDAIGYVLALWFEQHIRKTQDKYRASLGECCDGPSVEEWNYIVEQEAKEKRKNDAILEALREGDA